MCLNPRPSAAKKEISQTSVRDKKFSRTLTTQSGNNAAVHTFVFFSLKKCNYFVNDTILFCKKNNTFFIYLTTCNKITYMYVCNNKEIPR